MEDSRLNAIRQVITFVKFRLNFNNKSTTAANVQLTPLLDNCLKNNNITVDIIYYLRSHFVSFFLRILVFKSSTAKRQKNRILWQRAKIGSIGRPLGFVIDGLNTSASLYRIAPGLTMFVSKVNQNHFQAVTVGKTVEFFYHWR